MPPRIRLFSINNRWVIQVPRLFHIHKKTVPVRLPWMVCGFVSPKFKMGTVYRA